MTHFDGEKIAKKTSLRNNEYYSTQEIFDKLYKESKANKKFKNLMPLIVSEENIKLAYRNIRKNKGSKISGTNHRYIRDISKMSIEEVIEYVRGRQVEATQSWQVYMDEHYDDAKMAHIYPNAKTK